MLRCVQVLRRLMVRNKDVGVFCNVAGGDARQSRHLRAMPRFPRSQPRAGAVASCSNSSRRRFAIWARSRPRHLAALAQRGYRFSVDHVTDLRIEPRELADRGVRFIKVPAALLLDPAADLGVRHSSVRPFRPARPLRHRPDRRRRSRANAPWSTCSTMTCGSARASCSAPPRPLRPEGASATGGGPSSARRRNPMALADRFRRRSRPSSPPRGRPAMLRWRAAPPDAGLTGDLSSMTSLHFVERLRDLVGRHRMSCSRDIWGVVHNGLVSLSGSLRGAAHFRQQGGTVILITNAPRPADSVQRQLRKLGVADDDL